MGGYILPNCIDRSSACKCPYLPTNYKLIYRLPLSFTGVPLISLGGLNYMSCL